MNGEQASGSQRPRPGASSRSAADAASAPAALQAERSGQAVVAVPETGRYHRTRCRYARDIPGAQVLDVQQARAQGFDACGVCKP